MARKRHLTRAGGLLWLGLLLGLVAGACAAPGTPAAAPTQPAAEEAAPAAEGEPIKIAAAVNFIGWMAPYDMPPLQGARLAVKVLNERGGVLGRPLELLELDGKSDLATTKNVAIELINQGAEVLITPCDFDAGAPAAEAAQEAGIVGISTCASSPLYGSAALGDKQFTLSMWNQTMSSGAAEFSLEQGWQSAAAITDTSIEYSKSLGEFFIDSFEHNGGEVLSTDTYLNGDLQIDAQIQRLKGLAEPPDVIFLSTYGPDYAMMVRELRAAGFNQALFGGDAMDTAEFFDAVGDENNIFISTHSWLGPEAGPAMEEFLKLFQEEYGEPPESSFVPTGWDTVMVFAQAIEKAGTTEGDALARAMEEMTFDLLTGKLDWTSAEEGHEPSKETFILEIVDGSPTFETRWLPQYLTPTQ